MQLKKNGDNGIKVSFHLKGLEFIESAVENVITGVNFFFFPYFT